MHQRSYFGQNKTTPVVLSRNLVASSSYHGYRRPQTTRTTENDTSPPKQRTHKKHCISSRKNRTKTNSRKYSDYCYRDKPKISRPTENPAELGSHQSITPAVSLDGPHDPSQMPPPDHAHHPPLPANRPTSLECPRQVEVSLEYQRA